jgi:hypothetical protein
MTDYGIKVSKSGYSITDTDDKMLLTSKFPFLKAKSQGNLSVSVTGPGIFSATVTHSLGYFPVFVHYSIIDPASTTDRFFGRWGAGGPFGDIDVDSYISTSTLTIAWQDTSIAPGYFGTYPYTVYFYYYLFYDKLA